MKARQWFIKIRVKTKEVEKIAKAQRTKYSKEFTGIKHFDECLPRISEVRAVHQCVNHAAFEQSCKRNIKTYI